MTTLTILALALFLGLLLTLVVAALLGPSSEVEAADQANRTRRLQATPEEELILSRGVKKDDGGHRDSDRPGPHATPRDS